jgi:ribulose-5-phosphate 4-epimerase/fuculose-1-phosphate aldolase
LFDEITASSLIKIDMHGRKVEESSWPINPAGFTIHSAIHAARHDVQCVLHTHTINGVAVSAQKNGVLPVSQQSIFVLQNLGYHDYEGVALRDEEKPRLVASLGRKSFLMLRNHGLLTVGRSVAEAFQAMYIFEATCAIQLRAQSGGAELIPVEPRIIETAMEQARQVSNGQGADQLIWPGLKRRLDRLDHSYRT